MAVRGLLREKGALRHKGTRKPQGSKLDIKTATCDLLGEGGDQIIEY